MLITRKEKLSLDNKRLRVTSSVFSLNTGKNARKCSRTGTSTNLVLLLHAGFSGEDTLNKQRNV